MTCHDVHWALADTNPDAEPLRRECTSCHVNSVASAAGAPQIDLARINHVSSTGTPLEHLATEPNEACESCHMPKSSPTGSPMHLWRISTSATYKTMGAGQANTAADGSYANAAWVDVDYACGQCHGGSGSAQPGMPYFTTGQLAIAARGMHASTSSTDEPPIANETCSMDDNWTLTMIDLSSDDQGIKQETVTWGDGSVVLDDRVAPWGPYLHTYIGAGNYTITHKVVDTMGQLTQHTCAATASYYTISGVVSNNYPGNTAALPGATVTVTRVANGIVAGTRVTDASGAYSVGSLKPGDYSVAVSKLGFTFPAPATTHVGPSQTVDVNSPTPALRAVKAAPRLKKSPVGSGSIPTLK
jgi:hypothetical protein